MLIDSMYELTTKKNALAEKAKNYVFELIALTLHISKIEEMVIKLNFENLNCMSQLKEVHDLDGKEKKESSRLYIDLEYKLRDLQK